MVKVRLLTDGGYYGMGNVSFPVTVEGRITGRLAHVTSEELYNIGASVEDFTPDSEWAFVIEAECEVVHD